jgi:hypothetical protein
LKRYQENMTALSQSMPEDIGVNAKVRLLVAWWMGLEQQPFPTVARRGPTVQLVAEVDYSEAAAHLQDMQKAHSPVRKLQVHRGPSDRPAEPRSLAICARALSRGSQPADVGTFAATRAGPPLQRDFHQREPGSMLGFRGIPDWR